MADEPTEAKAISFRWKLGHPLLLCGLYWLGGVLVLLPGLAIAGFMRFLFPLSFLILISYYLLGFLLFGLLLGLLAVWREKSWLRKTKETYSHWLVFSQTSSSWETLRWQYPEILAIAGPLLIYFGVAWLFDKFVGSHSLSASPGFGMIFLTKIFLYPERARIYHRAKQLAADKTPEPLPEKTLRTGATWATSIGLFTIVAVFALSGWLLLWRPWSMSREPHVFTVESEPGGKATRLTYGASGEYPSASPDGKVIVFWRDNYPTSFLEIMNADGSSKRRLPPEFSLPELSLSDERPPQWSPDGRKLLVVGEQITKSARRNRLPAIAVNQNALLVEISDGKIQQLTQEGKIRAAVWISSTEVAVVKSEDNYRRLWIMNDAGKAARAINDFKVAKTRGALQVFPGGNRLLVRGDDESPGWWIVDTAEGKAENLALPDHTLALPLDADQLVVIQHKKIRPKEWQASVGLFDLSTQKIIWIAQGLKGGIFRPTLSPRTAALFFSRPEENNRDLWGLNLQNGQLRKLTQGETLFTVVVAPEGNFLVYPAIMNTPNIFFLSAIWRLDLKSDLWEKAQKQ